MECDQVQQELSTPAMIRSRGQNKEEWNEWEWEKLRNEELHDLYPRKLYPSDQNKEDELRGHVTCT